MNHPQAKNPSRGVIRKTLSSKLSVGQGQRTDRSTSAIGAGLKAHGQFEKTAVSTGVQSTLMALEPRMLFDGAALATVDHALQSDNHTADVSLAERLADSDAGDSVSGPLQATTLLVVDQSVQGWEQLVANRPAGTDLLVLDPAQDGLAQIASAVASYSNLQSIQIVSHGDAGVLGLGNRNINEASLNEQAGVLSQIGGALSRDGDILLFGCDLGSGAQGASFLQALARATQADVAASTNATGAASLGGDWVLEATTGSIEASSVLTDAAVAQFGSLLDTLPVNNGGTGVISGRLFDDTLVFDGALSANENGLGNVTVSLVWAGADDDFSTLADNAIYTVVTDASATAAAGRGTYAFTGLVDGLYRVAVPGTFTDSIALNTRVTGDFNDPAGVAGVDGVADVTIGTSQPTFTTADFYFSQINDAPVISAPSGQQNVPEDTVLAFTGPTAISIADNALDPSIYTALSNNYLVTLNVTNGVLDVNPTTGVAIVGDGTGSVTLTGSIANINLALATLTYTGNLNYVGSDNLVIRVDDRGSFGDADGDCCPNESVDDNLFATQTILICIDAVNDPPVPRPDANQIFNTATVPVTGNVITGGSSGDRSDSDPENNVPLTICGVQAGVPAGTPSGGVGIDVPSADGYGTLRLQSDGSYTYTVNRLNPMVAGLANGATLQDIFSYCVQDSNGATNYTTLTITITGNGLVVALPDANSTVEDATIPATGNVLTGLSVGDRADADSNGDPLTVCGVAPGTPSGTPSGSVGTPVRNLLGYGTLILNADGSYAYQIDNSLQRVQALRAGETVTDVFTYCVTDGNGSSDTTTLTITITGVNDPPTAQPDTNSTTNINPAPTTGNVLGGTGRAPTDVTDTDPDSSVLTVCGLVAGNSSATPSGNVGGLGVPGDYGRLTLNSDGTYSYVVDRTIAAVRDLAPGVILQDTFTYCVTDPEGATDRTTLTITITGAIEPPVANPDTNSTRADSTTPTTGNVLGGPGKAPTDATDTDPTNDPLTVCGVAPGTPAGTPNGFVGSPVNGKYGQLTLNANGTYSYQVDRSNSDVLALQNGQTRTDTFTYCVTDGKNGFDKTTLTITINGVNDCPVAMSDANTVPATTGSATTGNALGGPGAASTDRADTDPDGDRLTVCGVTAGAPNGAISGNVGTAVMGQYGTLTVNADGSYRYVVDATRPGVVALRPGQTLTDTFSYCVTDGVCDPQRAQITITLTGTNEPPVATGNPHTVNEGNSFVCDLGLVSDPEDSLADLRITIDSISNGASGTFYLREPIAGQPGQFRETVVTPGTVLTGEQLANLCFRADGGPNAPRGPDGALLAPTLNFTVTDRDGAQSSSSSTITIRPPVRVEPPVVPTPEVPVVVAPPVPVVPTPALILPPLAIFNPPTGPIVAEKLELAPPFDTVSLFDPNAAIVLPPLPERAVKSAADVADKPVAKEDDCVPTKPKPKPKAVKRSVYTDVAPKGAFSEQVKEAKKRFKLPAKVAPKVAVAKDC